MGYKNLKINQSLVFAQVGRRKVRVFYHFIPLFSLFLKGLSSTDFQVFSMNNSTFGIVFLFTNGTCR